VYNGQQRLVSYDLYIFQKAYLGRRTRALIDSLAAIRATGGGQLCFDLCDPDFLDPEHERRMLEVLPLFDFCTCPTPPLLKWLAQYQPAYLVPDGVDLTAITAQRIQTPHEQPVCGWIGYKQNVVLVEELAHAAQLPVEIVTVDKPAAFPVFLEKLVQYDILLNPISREGRFHYKSNNKSLIAWAAGLAVAETAAEVQELRSPEARQAHVIQWGTYVRTHCSMQQVVARWQAVCREVGIDGAAHD
jgi:hypothetical protein